MAVKDMTGQTCGKLYVIERDTTVSYTAAYWKCKCECGNIKSIRGQSLRDGSVVDCGCGAKERRKGKIDIDSIVGKRYGRLVVLERDLSYPIGHGYNSFWVCQCDCGQLTSVSKTNLLQGETKSCGCLQQETRKKFKENYSAIKDITGCKYGKLIAISRTEEKDKKNGYIWKCQCECGNIKNVPISLLSQGKVISCGCLTISKGEFKIQQLLQEAKIPFIKEYIFSDLKSETGQHYRYDFAILGENNTVLRLIEFDGEQHFQQRSEAFFSSQTLKERQQNDEIKNNYAKENSIPLARVPYYDLNKFTLEDLLGDKYLL